MQCSIYNHMRRQLLVLSDPSFIRLETKSFKRFSNSVVAVWACRRKERDHVAEKPRITKWFFFISLSHLTTYCIPHLSFQENDIGEENLHEDRIGTERKTAQNVFGLSISLISTLFSLPQPYVCDLGKEKEARDKGPTKKDDKYTENNNNRRDREERDAEKKLILSSHNEKLPRPLFAKDLELAASSLPLFSASFRSEDAENDECDTPKQIVIF